MGSRADGSPRLVGGRAFAGRRTVRDLDWPAGDRTNPPRLIGPWTAEDHVDAYRYYYANEKRHLFGWSKDRSIPPWIPEYTVVAGA